MTIVEAAGAVRRKGRWEWVGMVGMAVVAKAVAAGTVEDAAVGEWVGMATVEVAGWWGG